MCFRLAITNRAWQVIEVLYRVFQNTIEGINAKRTFWMRDFTEEKTDSEDNDRGDSSDEGVIYGHERKLSNLPEKSHEEEEDQDTLPSGNGQYSLLHYACSAGDYKIFRWVYQHCEYSEAELLTDHKGKPAKFFILAHKGNLNREQ